MNIFCQNEVIFSNRYVNRLLLVSIVDAVRWLVCFRIVVSFSRFVLFDVITIKYEESNQGCLVAGFVELVVTESPLMYLV